MKNKIMEINITSMKSCLFGLNKSQVNRTIEVAQKKEAENILQIEQKLFELRAENQELIVELDKLNEEIKSEKLEDDFLNYCWSKSGSYCNLFMQSVEKEMTEVDTIGRKIQSLYDDKIAEFEHSIKEAQSTLQGLLKDVTYKNEDIEDRLVKFLNEEGSYKFLCTSETDITTSSENTIEHSCDGNAEQISDDTEEKVNELCISLNADVQEPSENECDYRDISKEIGSIRSKYLIGKLAGTALIDSGGTTIILENQMITDEIIEKAEQQGKLDEIILNIKLPHLEN